MRSMHLKNKITKKGVIGISGVAVIVLVVLAGIMLGHKIGMKNMNVTVAKKGEKQFHNELFGENTYIFSPDDDSKDVNAVLEKLWQEQETNQFGTNRYAIYFLPGEYDDSIQVKVGFYMQIAGLGKNPTDTVIPSLQCDAKWLGDDESNHNACCNFWRSVENIEIGSNTMWAVSQATSMRRVKVDGALYLHDNYGWSSGGFLADSWITRMTDSGSQQQWLSRNNQWIAWMGQNWNMVFVGEEKGCAPVGTWPATTYTTVEETPAIEEKPFLSYMDGTFVVFVPNKREHSSGISWSEEQRGNEVPISDFYIAKPEVDTADTINEALEEQKNLIFTPGIYKLDKAIEVERKDTIILGMGLATLTPTNGNVCITTADVDGITIAGLLFDAGSIESENLLVVGDNVKKDSNDIKHKDNPICLSDLYFRVGGANSEKSAKVNTCVTINSDSVIGDNFWVWRADHGDNVAWSKNTAKNGIVINGDNTIMYALMVEHFQEYQTIWNGNDGQLFMYQSELPYDVPSQKAWMSHDGSIEGYASIYVNDQVTDFECWGLGIYSYNRDTQVTLHSAMEIPDTENIKVHNICTVMLTGYPGITHIINNSGNAVTNAGEREIICEYANGIQK